MTLVLALPCLWLVVSGARLRRQWMWPGLLAAAVAYLGATRWVSTPFMGARLLFLLPLFLLALSAGVMARDRLGAAQGMALVVANLVGLWAYFGARDILNLVYLTPNQRIAQEIVLHSRANDTVVWIDGLNFDEPTVSYYLPKNFRVRLLTSPESVAAARAELDAGDIRHVWFVRSAHDISPGQAFEKLESQMMETWPEEALHLYLPLSRRMWRSCVGWRLCVTRTEATRDSICTRCGSSGVLDKRRRRQDATVGGRKARRKSIPRRYTIASSRQLWATRGQNYRLPASAPSARQVFRQFAEILERGADLR